MVNTTRRRPTSSARGATGRERGASEVLMLILMTSLVAFAGLAYDAGLAFNARRDATNIAASAARIGANEVSTDALYGEGVAKLGPLAESTANAAVPSDVDVVEIYRASDDELFVKVEVTHESVFLQIVGIDSFVMSGEASARVQSGSN